MKTVGDRMRKGKARPKTASPRAIVPTPPKVPGPPSIAWLEDMGGLRAARFDLEVHEPIAPGTDWQAIVLSVSLRTGEPDGKILADYRARTKGHVAVMALASALGDALKLVNREVCDFCGEPADGRTKDQKLTCFYCLRNRTGGGS